MTTKMKGIPEGHHSLTPYLITDNAGKAIDFYQQAFGAKELTRLMMPNGKVGHAELQIGTSILMLADEFPEMNANSPKTYGGTPVSLALYVEDADATFNQAIAAGAAVTRPLVDQVWGDRAGVLTDPFGHVWTVATRIREVSAAEIEEKMGCSKVTQ